jgi:hypothetical protein
VCAERCLLQGLPELAPEDHRGFVRSQSSHLSLARGLIRPVRCWGVLRGEYFYPLQTRTIVL